MVMDKALLLLAVLAVALADVQVVPTAELEPSPYHIWAHQHWVWNKNGYSTQVNVTELIDDYIAHDIKVRVPFSISYLPLFL